MDESATGSAERENVAGQAFIALGSNLGDRLRHLQDAVDALRQHPDVEVLHISPLYESSAHTLTPEETQPPFLNAVIAVQSALGPETLLALLHRMEAAAGRDRRRRWAPRTLDLDLLLYDEVSLVSERLTIPHPRLAERRFVLRPLADLAPNLRVPSPFDATVSTLLTRCSDPNLIRVFDAVLEE